MNPPPPHSTSLLSPQPASASGLEAPIQATGAAELTCDALIKTVEVMVNQLEKGIEWRDGHSGQVARLALRLAKYMELSEEEARLVQLAALAHELAKPVEAHLTLLSLEEHAELKAHAATAYLEPARLLEQTGLPDQVLLALQAMYERFDGKGVPGKHSRQQIPLAARVLAVADAYYDLLLNPHTPGGSCDSVQEALLRLDSAASKGLMDPKIVGLLSRAASDDLGVHAGERSLVLIIDEDGPLASDLGGKLQSAGYEVRIVHTTGDAALILLGEKVSMVLSEVQLKPMDGFTFLEWIRANDRTAQIPFMFISSREHADDVNRGFELGAVDYVVKPFSSEVLLAKIRRALA